jgi:hypothetical protein
LYVALSPITQAALIDMAAAMRNATLRFWTVEHPTLMIAAVVFGHVARIISRRQMGLASGRTGRGPVLWYGLALVAILAATPWPFLSYGRPLFRW